jgi:RNA polymerase sigma-70 factor, ECF subfamily
LPDETDIIAVPGVEREQAPGGAVISFNDVYREYGQTVIGWLRRLGVAESDLEDVFQNVFLAIHHKLPTYEGRAKLSTWLYKFCVYKACDYHSQRRRHRRSQALLLLAVPEECDAQGDAEQRLLAQRGLSLLQQALASMPEDQVLAFIMYEVEGLSVKEVASIQRCPLFTVYGRLRMARRKILAIFDPDEDVAPEEP